MSKTVKRLLGVLGVLLVGVLLTVLVSNLLGIAEWNVKEVNEDNLYQSLTFADANGVIASGEDGISVKLDEEDNTIKVKGTAGADVTYLIGTTTLKAGTSYIFDGSLEEGSNQTIYVSVVNKSTGEVIKSSYRDAVLISADSITADTEVKIEITIKADTTVNETLEIILCEGNDVDEIVNYFK
ncbi:MAG: hypothetical protein IJX39_00265 [Clostridia bacterium]|nr:hypothetical protein [Clostridia bacterium]